MSNQNGSNVSETPIGELSIQQIIAHMGERTSAMAIGVLVPDDGDSCETLTYTSGNRVAALGLCELTKVTALGKLTEVVQPVKENEVDGDANGD